MGIDKERSILLRDSFHHFHEGKWFSYDGPDGNVVSPKGTWGSMNPGTTCNKFCEIFGIKPFAVPELNMSQFSFFPHKLCLEVAAFIIHASGGDPTALIKLGVVSPERFAKNGPYCYPADWGLK